MKRRPSARLAGTCPVHKIVYYRVSRPPAALNVEVVVLTRAQKNTLVEIALETLAAQADYHCGKDVIAQIDATAAKAHKLYTDLVKAGKTISFSPTMIKNRSVKPNTVKFFRHLHALQDFVSIVNALDSK
jgi:hypothetical protein